MLYSSMNSSRFFVSFEDLILSQVPFGFDRVDMYCESCGGDYHGRVFGLVYWGENYECTCSEWCPLIVYYDNVDFREVIYMTNKPKEIVDIDAGDANNELAAVEYLEDIYKFCKIVENENRPHDYMDSQPEINEKKSAILIDWLVDVHTKFQILPEAFYLTINIVDRLLAVKLVPRRELQLVASVLC
ncbi:unnamed protein product [Trifolium pratense]|uniref:Uncharacterized protein n=1 Tax=Trifolium pratense TaxID=57577 RepID=A0ACB0JE00_TRIPR|nr:unnamed protein product [Trifolium pratense]